MKDNHILHLLCKHLPGGQVTLGERAFGQILTPKRDGPSIQFLHWKSVIFDVILNFLNKPLFEGWPTDYYYWATWVGISVSADIAHIGKTDISVSVIIPADTYRPICNIGNLLHIGRYRSKFCILSVKNHCFLNRNNFSSDINDKSISSKVTSIWTKL